MKRKESKILKKFIKLSDSVCAKRQKYFYHRKNEIDFKIQKVEQKMSFFSKSKISESSNFKKKHCAEKDKEYLLSFPHVYESPPHL